MITFTEENYLKALLTLSTTKESDSRVGTNEIATRLNVKPATANDMLKRLKDKGFIEYEKYGKISLTSLGRERAVVVLRKHRLWETFLYEKLEFTWDEVHEVAEQLEHIQSEKLVDKLDKYLEYPEFDPHGDPIPKSDGSISALARLTLTDIDENNHCKIVAVKDTSVEFLQYVQQLGLGINSLVHVLSKQAYDLLTEIEIGGKRITVSQKIMDNIYVVCSHCESGKKCTNRKCNINI
ncbi:MAG: metal-dependent transcriptional regulator [Ignavibacteria bacterium]|nr:metal-dependent transcriptional regulator [Ignavibacteria bacterium]